jgi:phosphoribosylformimino-5-aminoimidazole carboxamide ribotide isomerase
LDRYNAWVLVVPAVDLQQGRAVRLTEGDPERSSVYFEDPLEAALHWQTAGARWLHVVDLDAALGVGDNMKILAAILRQVNLPVEVGGGIRSLERAQSLLDLGAARVVVGTVAIEEPSRLAQMLQTLGPEHVAVALDARGFQVVVRGWKHASSTSVPEVLEQLAALDLETLIYTDVRRDGTLSGPDLELFERVRALWPKELWVGGGVGSEADLQALARLNIQGVIVGKALYEGRLRLI